MRWLTILLLSFALVSCSAVDAVNIPDLQKITVYVDFSLPSTQKRLFVYSHGQEILSAYVTHGEGSGDGVMAVYFSNEPDSHASSLGTFEIIEKYEGRHGMSFRLRGLSASNSNAESRDIVIHSADYIGHNQTGRSWGCFAVPPETMRELLKLLPIGTLLIATK